MINQTFQYDQTSVRLQIEGLPDLSIDNDKECLGIISTWTLSLVGSPSLEGKREHLQALMATVLPYSRHCISDVKSSFGDASGPIRIEPSSKGHKLSLVSSKPDIPPLAINLDDAELADLVHCLDDMRMDPRVKINWDLPVDMPLTKRQIAYKTPLAQRIGAPLIGGSLLLIYSLLLLVLPIPDGEERKLNDQTEPLEVSLTTKL